MGKQFRILIGLFMIIGMFAIDNQVDFLKNVDLLTIILYLLFALMIMISEKYSLIVYLLFLIRVLLVRNSKVTGINMDLYLSKWLKIVFTNKIVFFNIIGNVVIFMPLPVYIRNLVKKDLIVLLSLVIIVCFEVLQFVLQVGVLDINDIILNFLGVVISSIALEIYGGIYERQKEKARRNA